MRVSADGRKGRGASGLTDVEQTERAQKGSVCKYPESLY